MFLNSVAVMECFEVGMNPFCIMTVNLLEPGIEYDELKRMCLGIRLARDDCVTVNLL